VERRALGSSPGEIPSLYLGLRGAAAYDYVLVIGRQTGGGDPKAAASIASRAQGVVPGVGTGLDKRARSLSGRDE